MSCEIIQEFKSLSLCQFFIVCCRITSTCSSPRATSKEVHYYLESYRIPTALHEIQSASRKHLGHHQWQISWSWVAANFWPKIFHNSSLILFHTVLDTDPEIPKKEFEPARNFDYPNKNCYILKKPSLFRTWEFRALYVNYVNMYRCALFCSQAIYLATSLVAP